MTDTTHAALEALEFFRDTAICEADTAVATEAIAALRELCAWRQRAIDATLAQIEALRQHQGEPQQIALAWYPTREAWMARKEGDPLICWRPHCSVVAHIAATVPGVVLKW